VGEARRAAPGEISGLRVLVVDDDRDARHLLKQLLEDCSASVTTAASAGEAAAHLQRTRFDVLVSDIGMPGEDGHALIRRVRALGPGRGDIPAIALTAYAGPEDRLQAVRAGFQMHLAKPVEPAELIAVVASVAKRL
jgi:CheY-like chemotaxis protein